MSEYTNETVPFMQMGAARVLTDQQLVEEPWLRDFVERFRHCFEYHPLMSVWVYRPGDPRVESPREAAERRIAEEVKRG